MTVEYLDAKRVQGSSTGAKTPTYEAVPSDFDISDAGTKLNKSGSGATSKITFNVNANQINEWAFVDIGSAVSDSLWTMRFKITFTTISDQVSDANECQLSVGLWDSSAVSGEVPSGLDGLAFNLRNVSGTILTQLASYESGSWQQTNGTDEAQIGQSTTTAYVELARTSATAGTIKVFSDSSYSTQVGATITDSGISSNTGLEYLVVRIYTQTVGSTTIFEGTIEDIDIWNNSSATQDDKATLLTGGFGSDTTLHVNNNTGNAYHIATSSSYAANGVFVNSSANDALVDAEIQSVSFYLKGSSLTGTITCSAYNADGSLIGAIGTYDVSGLTTSWQKITFSGTDRVLPKDGFLQMHDVSGYTGGTAISINGIATTGTVFEACRTASLNGTPIKLSEGVNCEIVYKPVASLLQENTIFNETNTFKQYWLQSGEWKRSYIIPTWESDFTSSTGWTASGSRMEIVTGSDWLYFDVRRDSTQDTLFYDLGAGNISNTNWTLRMKVAITAFGTGSNSEKSWIFGFSNLSNESYGSSSNHLAYGHKVSDNATEREIVIRWGDAEGANANVEEVAEGDNLVVAGTTYWYELQRIDTTTLRANIYSDSEFSTLVATRDQTITAGDGEDMRYFRCANNTYSQTLDGYVQGYIQDIKFYNGVNL